MPQRSGLWKLANIRVSQTLLQDEDEEMGTTAGDGERRESHAEAGPRPYEARRVDGTPQPLTPELLTLSLLPRTQWHNLAHLDAIKVIAFGSILYLHIRRDSCPDSLLFFVCFA